MSDLFGFFGGMALGYMIVVVGMAYVLYREGR